MSALLNKNASSKLHDERKLSQKEIKTNDSQKKLDFPMRERFNEDI
jgi:hypothetical protein